jgi:NTP pyrophosphatase (non-canonical NTP hydrolase)
MTQPLPPQTTSGAAWNDSLSHLIRQCTGDSSRWFPKNQDLAFTTLAMAGEVGEVANLVKKVVRGSHELEEVLGDLEEEVVDVLIYLLNLMGAKEFEGVDWMMIWNRKRAFNAARFGPRVEIIDPKFGTYGPTDEERSGE